MMIVLIELWMARNFGQNEVRGHDQAKYGQGHGGSIHIDGFLCQMLSSFYPNVTRVPYS